MKKALLISTMALILLGSCTERIDVELDESFTRLVVYGTVTTDTTVHYVELSKTTSYFYDQAPPPVSGAFVEISDSEGNSIVLEEVKAGSYATPGDYHAVPGRTYTLRIELPEEINGNKTYMASSGVANINPIDSIGLRFQPDWGPEGFYEVQCYYQDPPTEDYYMFNIFKNGELLTDTISNRLVTDDAFFNGSYTNGIGVGFLNQEYEREKLSPGDTITFQGCGIQKEYFTFIWTLQQETGFSTPLFSGPPANVKSNVNNGAAGFFAVYSVSYASTVLQTGR